MAGDISYPPARREGAVSRRRLEKKNTTEAEG